MRDASFDMSLRLFFDELMITRFSLILLRLIV